MSEQSMDEARLKAIMKSAIIEVLGEQRELVRSLISEAIEDIAMGRAIDEGTSTKVVDTSEVYDILDKRP